jgi:uncharacterized membrane protein YfcA
MSLMTIAEMLCLGAAFGGFGGLFGVGGGIIAIPALVLLFHMDQQTAQGTTLVMMLPTVLRGFVKYQRRNNIDLRMALMLAGSAVVSTYIFARIANTISTDALRGAFGAFLALIAVYLALKALRRADNAPPHQPLPWSYSWIVGIIGGALSGLFGVGGATIAPPALTTFFGLTQTAAQGLALAMIAPGTIVALAVYAHAGAIEWAIGLAMAVGGLIAVPLGVAAAHKIRDERLKLMFSGLVMLSAMMIFASR